MAAPTIAVVPTGTKSVIHNAALKGFELVGDASAPGADKYYGTNAGGAKGFHDVPSGGGTVTTNSGLTGDGSAGSPVGILNGGVTTDRLNNMAVTSTKIAVAGVETNNIATDAVTQAKIANNAVGPDQLIATGIAAGTYTNPTVVFDVDGRATSATNGTGGGLQVVTGANYDGVSQGTGITVTLAAGLVTIALAAGVHPQNLAIPIGTAQFDGGGEMLITITHADNPPRNGMISMIPEVRYMNGTSGTGGIGDNVASDQVTASAAGSITVQYTNASTIVPDALLIITF